jgi:gas vesicle protein
MSDNSSSSKVILALLAGAGIGAIMGASAALLLSPNDGKTNRKKLKEKINEWTDDFHEKTESIIEDIEEELDNLKTESETETKDEK